VPHPADVTIEAWGPTREACLAEAVSGLTESFADRSNAQAADTVALDIAAEDDEERLVAALDQLIYLLDTQGFIPLSVDVGIGPQTLRLTMSGTSINNVELIGASPKAVALSGLEFKRVGNGWRCRATIDV
jgi:SHS2 domain-containing protein